MTEEKLRLHIEGHSSNAHSPFKVPEGYFDTLCDRIMERLPEQEKPRRTFLMRLMTLRALRHAIATAAACLVAAVIIQTSVHYYRSLQKNETISAAITEEIIKEYQDEEYVEQALDYAMIDNHEIAIYLTSCE